MILGRIRTFNEKLNDVFFPRALPRYVDRFRDLTCQLSSGAEVVVHLGSGRVDLEPVLGKGHLPRRVLALDLSLEALRQNTSTLKVCGDAEALPLGSGSVDLIVAQHVFEHFPRPGLCLRECFRVLKREGKLVVSGPNGRSYVAAMARLTPLTFHRRVHLLNRDGDGEVFTTFYRFNSPRTMRRLAAEAGLDVVSVEKFVGEPCYTNFLPLVHLVFIAYHLALEKLKPHFGFHITSVAVFRKPRD